MAHFKLYSSDDFGTHKNQIGTYSTKEDAAKAGDEYIHGEREHECIHSLLERNYYMRGYSTGMLIIDEVD